MYLDKKELMIFAGKQNYYEANKQRRVYVDIRSSTEEWIEHSGFLCKRILYRIQFSLLEK